MLIMWHEEEEGEDGVLCSFECLQYIEDVEENVADDDQCDDDDDQCDDDDDDQYCDEFMRRITQKI